MIARICAALAACTLTFAAPVVMAATADADDFRAGNPGTPFYGRSDGLFWHRTAKTPVLIGNGDGYMPLGPTYRETFSYGDGLGVTCSSILRPIFTIVAGANTACSTTCGNSACVAGFEDAMANAADVLACSDGTADGCLCQSTSVDHDLPGCGANWEAPALGVSLITTGWGTVLAHAALLAQDIGPDMDADGLDISADLTDNDGVELFGGMYGASGRPLIPNVDPAFKFCVNFATVEDVSGTDDLRVGFRSPEDVLATFDDYDTLASIGIGASANIEIETIDDGAATTTTDTTDNATDAAQLDLCVLVSDTGVVTYTINGSAPTATAAFTFDSGEPVIPFVHLLHSSDVANEVVIDLWEVSYQ